MKEAEMEQIADWIDAAITARDDDAKLTAIHEEVKLFTKSFPLPGEK
jgi:glycine/serine hydroxymethyltransferase